MSARKTAGHRTAAVFISLTCAQRYRGDSASHTMMDVGSGNDAEGKYGMKGRLDGEVRVALGNIYACIEDAVDDCQMGFDKLKD